jgi:hypothetical protein
MPRPVGGVKGTPAGLEAAAGAGRRAIAPAPGWLAVAAGAPSIPNGAQMQCQQLLKERRQVHDANRPVLWTAAVAAGVEFVQLPRDVHDLAADAFRPQSHRLAPPSACVGDGDQHHEVGVSA